jgi:hypothetical protein
VLPGTAALGAGSAVLVTDGSLLAAIASAVIGVALMYGQLWWSGDAMLMPAMPRIDPEPRLILLRYLDVVVGWPMAMGASVAAVTAEIL